MEPLKPMDYTHQYWSNPLYYEPIREWQFGDVINFAEHTPLWNLI